MIRRWERLLGYERFLNEGKIAYIRLNIQTPCPPRGAVPVNQGRAWKLFHSVPSGSNVGDGCDRPAMWEPLDRTSHGLSMARQALKG